MGIVVDRGSSNEHPLKKENIHEKDHDSGHITAFRYKSSQLDPEAEFSKLLVEKSIDFSIEFHFSQI